MSFTTPIALLGLLSLPVILALHMLRSRSEQVPVSSLTLWRFLNPQVRGASARRLPITLLLILDLAIAALLSLALAGPQLDLNNLVRENVHTVLLVDVSTSMGATDAAPTRLDAALADARSLVAGSAGGDVFTVITFGAAARTAADSRTESFETDLAALGSLAPGEGSGGFEAALSLARASTDPEIPAEVHVFTDGAFPAPALDEFSLPLIWHRYGASADNQAVLAFRAARLSESKLQVFARIANLGGAPAARSATLYAAGEPVSEIEITLEPGTSQTYSWELIGSYAHLAIEMGGADDLPLDDRAFTAVPASPGDTVGRLSVAIVAEQPGPLRRALEVHPGAEVQVIAPEDYLPGSPFDLVAFRGFLPERWPSGTVLVVDPPPESSLLGSMGSEDVTEALFPAVDPLLEDVDWTGVRWSRAWVPETLPHELDPLLTAGRLELLLHGRVGLTELVVLLAETADENGTPSGLARHPAFPVLTANILRLAAGTDFPQQIPVGSPLALPAADRYPVFAVETPGGEVLTFDAARPPDWSGLRTPGIAALDVEDQEGTAGRYYVGINAGDLAESDIAPGSWPVAIVSPDRPAAETEQPLALAPWLLAAAAVLLLAEAWWAWR